MIQLNQLAIDGALTNLRTIDRTVVGKAFTILNSIIAEPCQISLAGNIITVGSSEYQTLYSDTVSSTANRELRAAGIHSGKYITISESTLNISTGATTGDYATDTCPSVTANYYITVAIELRSSDRKWHIVFGTENATANGAWLEANIAKFSNTAVIKRAIIVLQKNGSTGLWGFLAPTYTNLKVLPLGSGGGGSGTDLVPIYKDANTLTIQSTSGQKIRLNTKYFYLTSDLDISFNKTSDGVWYICVDTSLAEGILTSSYIVLTMVGPSSANFNSNYCILGEYTVSSGVVVSSTLNGYSIREMTSWVNALPNMKRASEQKTAAGTYTLTTGFGASPSSVVYRYWDNSASIFYNFDRADIEISYTNTGITYEIPASDSIVVFAAGDYFEIEAFYYNYQGTGLASPKTDYATDWYTSTPSTTITHTLGSNPLSIIFEFNRNGVYAIEDGSQFVNKETGGIEATQVTFEWSGLETLSSTNKLRIHFGLSKVAAGAFEASKTERGTVSVTGDSSLVESPDLILTSTSTDFASLINAAGNNILVYQSENITLTAEQILTITGCKFRQKKGVKLICATAGINALLTLSGDDVDIEAEIEMQHTTGTITSGLVVNANNCEITKTKIIQNGSGGTLTNGVVVNIDKYGNCINALVYNKAGTISNALIDDSNNSTNDINIRYRA